MKLYFILINLIITNFLFSLNQNLKFKIDEIRDLNLKKIIQFSNNIETTRSIVIEDFENDTLILISHGEDDIDSDAWYLSSFTSDSSSNQSLVLYGNTWKDQEIENILIDENSVWKIDMYSGSISDDMSSEIQAFGFEDTLGNRLYYSIWGSQSVDVDFFENYYQGFFAPNQWTEIILPLGSDWYDRFEYNPTITTLFYVNDDDWWFSDSIYFDNIMDISEDLPIPPSVSISIESNSIIDNIDNDRIVQSYNFLAIVDDSDSQFEELKFNWDFGDGSTDTIFNPEHSFEIQDDHFYNVFLTVEDQTGLMGYAIISVGVDEGVSTFPIKINFVGDIMMGRRYNCTSAPTNDEECNDGIIPTCGSEYLFDYINPYFGDIADISVGNLETPITDYPDNPHPTKSIIFYSESETMEGLEYSGIDAVSLANNHFLDYMVEGMVETQQNLDSAGIKYFGAGLNEEEAMSPIFINKSGVNLGFIGSSDRDGRENNEQPYLDAGYNKPGFYLNSEENLQRQIGQMDLVSDLVILNIHSGSEYSTAPRFYEGEDENYDPFFTEPTRENIEFRHFAIDEGIDLVINHHPHVLQGIELYNEKIIAHSLGNFVFDQRYPETWPTVILNAEIDQFGFAKYWIQPVYVHNYIPKPATGKLAHRILDYMAFKSRKFNTYLSVDYDNEIAEVLLNPENIQSNIFYILQDSLINNGEGIFESNPLELNRVGSIKDIDFMNGDNFEFRLGREIIWNGDFEYNPQMNCWNPGINYWRLLPAESEFINDSIFYNGSYALQQVRYAEDENNAVTEISYCVPIDNDFEHTVHTVVKGQNTSNARVNAYYYSDRNCGNNVETESFTGNLTGDFDWTYFDKKLELHEDANFVDLIIRSTPPESGISNAYFDDLGIIQWEHWNNIDGLDSLLFPNDYYYIQFRSTNEIMYKAKINEIVYKDLVNPQPHFIADNLSVCVGETVQLLNNSTGTNVWWQWNVEGHETSNDENPFFTINEVGMFDVSLSIFDFNGDLISHQIDNYLQVYSCYIGDVNMDDAVNVIDVIAVVNMILAEAFFELADLNNDNEINVLDILLLISIILEDS